MARSFKLTLFRDSTSVDSIPILSESSYLVSPSMSHSGIFTSMTGSYSHASPQDSIGKSSGVQLSRALDVINDLKIRHIVIAGAEIRITQEIVEILRKGKPYARLTQDAIEVLRVGAPYARITQDVVEVLRANLTKYKLFEIDAILKGGVQKTLEIDAVLAGVNQKTLEIDAILTSYNVVDDVVFEWGVPICIYEDDFTGNNGDPPNTDLWTETDIYNVMHINDNQLYLGAPAVGITYQGMCDSRWHFKSGSDFDIQIDYATSYGCTNKWQFMPALTINDGAGKWARVVRGCHTAAGDVAFAEDTDGFWSHYKVRSADGAQDRWYGKVRIRRVGSVIQASHWSDYMGRWEWNGVAGWVTLTESWIGNTWVRIHLEKGSGLALDCWLDNFLINEGCEQATFIETITKTVDIDACLTGTQSKTVSIDALLIDAGEGRITEDGDARITENSDRRIPE